VNFRENLTWAGKNCPMLLTLQNSDI